MLLQAALNGDLNNETHAALPVSVEELTRDAVACVAAGAQAIHLHPRDSDGREQLDPQVIDEVVVEVRSACGVAVGVSTGAWIEPDLDRRLELVRAWTAPDYASVNLSEAGAGEVMQALIEAGIGVEAGVWSVEDAERLAATGLGARVTRILVEPVDAGAEAAVEVVDEIHGALDGLGLTAPRLQHGDGEATWVLVGDAVRRGLDTRIGFEDTLHGPDGERASGNEALVRAARELGAGLRETRDQPQHLAGSGAAALEAQAVEKSDRIPTDVARGGRSGRHLRIEGPTPIAERDPPVMHQRSLMLSSASSALRHRKRQPEALWPARIVPQLPDRADAALL